MNALKNIRTLSPLNSPSFVIFTFTVAFILPSLFSKNSNLEIYYFMLKENQFLEHTIPPALKKNKFLEHVLLS